MNYEEIVQPQEFCVENVFKGTEYVVPIYQRNYAWTKDEIEQLFQLYAKLYAGVERVERYAEELDK